MTRSTASMISRTDRPVPLPKVVDRLQRPAFLKGLGSGDMGERQVGDMDVVTDRVPSGVG